MSSFGCTPDAEWVLKINYARGLCGRPYTGSLGHGFIKLTSKAFRQNSTTDPHGIVGSTEFITGKFNQRLPPHQNRLELLATFSFKKVEKSLLQ